MERAIVCFQPFGHAAEPWKTFDILSDIGRHAGRPEAAFECGGERSRPISPTAATAVRISREGSPASSATGCSRRSRMVKSSLWCRSSSSSKPAPTSPPISSPSLTALRGILAGNRDPALADDPAFNYDDAAEILLLLECLRAL